jgi:concentrative nucleoside transporter, CNT family
MERFTGLIGIALILGLAYLLSNNRKAINYRLVLSGLAIQLVLAVFVLKTDVGQWLFQRLGDAVNRLLELADKGGEFVFGVLMDSKTMGSVFGADKGFVFMFKLMPAIIFVAVLVNIAYHIGLMQRIVQAFAWVMQRLMQVSGAEALSNVASTFVGQVEAQIMIKPYLAGMTRSELMASMTGSFACIAGGVMAVYISMGVPAPYLLAASIMAAPGALVISKIMIPETESSQTKGSVKLEVKKTHVNILDAISHGASDGFKVSLNVIAMLIGFIALIALADFILVKIGWTLHWAGLPVMGDWFSLNNIFGHIFSVFAWAMGVPGSESVQVGGLLGTKLVINEFVAYSNLAPMIKEGALSQKAIVIASFACCGFANFSSVAIQVGGIGELAPERRGDLARLGLRALLAGTLASYLSATIAGMLVG